MHWHASSRGFFHFKPEERQKNNQIILGNTHNVGLFSPCSVDLVSLPNLLGVKSL